MAMYPTKARLERYTDPINEYYNCTPKNHFILGVQLEYSLIGSVYRSSLALVGYIAISRAGFGASFPINTFRHRKEELEI